MAETFKQKSLSGTQVCQLWGDSKSRRGNWMSVWQEQASYIMPGKSVGLLMDAGAVGVTGGGEKRTDYLLDSTANHANEMLAASMHGALTSSAFQWFALRLRREELNENFEVKDWLEKCSGRMYLAFNNSNFASEISEVYLDLGCFGTGSIFVDQRQGGAAEGFPGFVFTALPVGDFSIEEDADGSVNSIFYVRSLTAAAAYARYGEKCSEKVKGDCEKNPYTRVAFIHAILPREGGKAGLRVPAKQLPVASYVVEIETKKKVHEGGFQEFPACVPRWRKASGEVYGRGPGHTALPDIKTLNRLVEMHLKAGAKNEDPPVEVSGEVEGRVSLQPGAINYTQRANSITAIQSGVNWQASDQERQDLRQSIRNIYSTDQLQLQGNKDMTATEAQLRYELMQRILGPTLGRLESELLNRLVERCFAMMLRSGAFPEPPAILQQMQGEDALDVEYLGPLAKAQRASELEATMKVATSATNIAAVVPEIMDVVDWDEVVRQTADITGAPVKIIRDKNAVAQIRAQRAKAQAEQARAAQASQDAQDLSKIGPGIKAAADAAEKSGMGGEMEGGMPGQDEMGGMPAGMGA